jgi:hypothetical protein
LQNKIIKSHFENIAKYFCQFFYFFIIVIENIDNGAFLQLKLACVKKTFCIQILAKKGPNDAHM